MMTGLPKPSSATGNTRPFRVAAVGSAFSRRGAVFENLANGFVRWPDTIRPERRYHCNSAKGPWPQYVVQAIVVQLVQIFGPVRSSSREGPRIDGRSAYKVSSRAIGGAGIRSCEEVIRVSMMHYSPKSVQLFLPPSLLGR